MLECSSHAANLSAEMAISCSEVKNTLEDEGSQFLEEDFSQIDLLTNLHGMSWWISICRDIQNPAGQCLGQPASADPS